MKINYYLRSLFTPWGTSAYSIQKGPQAIIFGGNHKDVFDLVKESYSQMKFEVFSKQSHRPFFHSLVGPSNQNSKLWLGWEWKPENHHTVLIDRKASRRSIEIWYFAVVLLMFTYIVINIPHLTFYSAFLVFILATTLIRGLVWIVLSYKNRQLINNHFRKDMAYSLTSRGFYIGQNYQFMHEIDSVEIFKYKNICFLKLETKLSKFQIFSIPYYLPVPRDLMSEVELWLDEIPKIKNQLNKSSLIKISEEILET